MFFAHLPAGYLTARSYQTLARPEFRSGLLLAGLAGGLFPDLDLVYALWVDGGRQHHHLYWPHLPAIWLVLTPLAWTLAPPRFQHPVRVFLMAVWGHLLLDSVAGDIWWLWPWVDTPYSLVAIPARYHPWWLNFLLHWTFALEAAICLLAGAVLLRDRALRDQAGRAAP